MGWLGRLRNLGRRDRVGDEIEEELRAHIEMAVEDGLRVGMSEAEARRAARLRFGNPVAVREKTMGADAALAIEGIGRNVRFALRQMRKSPGFAVTAVLTLALGIGATTAVFTLIDQVMLRPLPVSQPQELWRIGDAVTCCYAQGYTQDSDTAQNDWSLFSWETYQLFRARTPAFADLAAFEEGEGNAELSVRRAGSAEPAETGAGEYVSGNFFRTLGVAAWRGRLFTDADDREGAPPVAVMSFHTWQEKYGSDASVVGATWQINGHPFTVIGVAPPGFFGARVASWGMPDIWLPLTTEPLMAGATSRLKNPALAWLDVMGRVRPGTHPQALEAQLQGELHQWLASHAAAMSAGEKAVWRKQTLHVTPGGGGVSLMRAEYGGGLRLLLLAAVCVLLVACANLANLLLARGLRQREAMAVRVALGASRGRLVRQSLVESLTLASIGGAAGLAVAYGGARLILHLAFRGGDGWVPVSAAVSWPALLFALGTAGLTGILFGMGPALAASQAEPVEAMRGGSRTVGGRRGISGTAGAQKALVMVQTALSLVLVSAAALLGQSLRNLERQDYGFAAQGRYVVSIDAKISGVPQEQLATLYEQMEARLRAVPGVRAVGAVLEGPPGGWITHEVRLAGRPEPGPRADCTSGWTRVTPGFFATMGDRIVRGRGIGEEDNASAQPVAVVNEVFARKFFGRENPVGQHFGPAPEKYAGLYTIVGVAANVEFEGNPQQPMYFLPEAQSTAFDDAETESREVWSHYLYNVVLWAPGNPPGLAGAVRRALGDVDPNLAIYDVESYEELIRGNFAQQRMIASLTWLFGAAALALAAVGLYGVTAYGVEQRTGEIGVRIALGADRAAVVGMVLRSACWPVGVGLMVGIPAAIGAGWAMASRLFGMEPWSPLLLGGATGLLVVTALAAALLPAHRAAGMDPLRALRME